MQQRAFKTIKLERTMCFGPCPEYKVSIHFSGRVTYPGMSYAEMGARHIWYIDSLAIKKLEQALQRCDYFNLKSEETGILCTDMSYCNTRVELQDGQKRQISHYLQEPDEWPKALTRFEEQVDNIIGVKAYIGKTARI